MIRTAFWSQLTNVETASATIEIADLVRRALDGDSEAFESIILRYERRVVSLATKLLGRTEDAQDAAQEVFLRVYKYLHRLDLQKPIEPWLMRMTVNVSRDIGRKRQLRLNAFPESESADAVPARAGCNPFEEVAAEQQRQLLWKALSSLPEKERIAVTLRDIEGLSTSEVAEILESSESTVRSQISRARVRLKDAMDSMIGGQQ
jgi:RNA polymerase sigma-70 factor (ECF subfamily)